MPSRSDCEPSQALENVSDSYLAGEYRRVFLKATILPVVQMSILPELP
jgi:hypothetical protein